MRVEGRETCERSKGTAHPYPSTPSIRKRNDTFVMFHSAPSGLSARPCETGMVKVCTDLRFRVQG